VEIIGEKGWGKLGKLVYEKKNGKCETRQGKELEMKQRKQNKKTKNKLVG
jgi:hypothetical protein